MTLYDIQGEFLRFYEVMVGQEDEEVFNDTLEALKGDLQTKAVGYAHIIKQLEMESEECDRIIAEFAEKQNRRDTAVKRMKEAILEVMETAKIDTLTAGEYTFKIHGNGGKQPMTIDTEKVPEDMKRTTITVEPDKAKIRMYLEAGHEVDWAKLEPRGKHVVIK